MSKKNQDDFNFFVPAEISKGKGEDSGKWLIEGVCSTTAKDSDGEVLEPAGYDFSPLIDKGYINWNHQAGKSAGAIVGRPTEAQIINGGQDFYIKGFLYKGLDEAKNVYNLAKTLQEEDPDRRLGWSIEGQAIERDPLNKKRITKARITGVALTSCPKNPNTFASIIKGEYAEAFVNEIEPGFEASDLQKWAVHYKDWANTPADGDMYGNEASVREFLENNYEDHVEVVKDLCDVISKNKEMEKAMTAEAAQGTTAMESVDGGNEKLKRAFLKKSEVYEVILSKIESRDFNLIKSIYSFTEEVNKKIFNMENITLEAIEKAFDLLNDSTALIKGTEEVTEDLTKSQEVEETEDQKVEKACEMLKESLEKGDAQEVAVASLKEHFELGVVDKAVASVIASMEGESENGETADGKGLEAATPGNTDDHLNVVQKSEEVQEGIAKEIEKVAEALVPQADFLTKSDLNEFTQSIVGLINQKFEGTGTILKGLYDTLNTEKEQVQTLLVAQEDLTKSNELLTERLAVIEKTPIAPRAVTSQVQFAERFNKSQDAGVESYSLSNTIQKGALLDILFEKAQSGGPDGKAFEKALNQIECTGSLDDANAIAAIRKAGISIVR